MAFQKGDAFLPRQCPWQRAGRVAEQVQQTVLLPALPWRGVDGLGAPFGDGADFLQPFPQVLGLVAVQVQPQGLAILADHHAVAQSGQHGFRHIPAVFQGEIDA